MTRIFPGQHPDNAETSRLIIPWTLISLHKSLWQRAGKENPEPHDAPVQPEEAREVIIPFPLTLGSQRPEQSTKGCQGVDPKNREKNVVTQEWESR